jgi:hypothetical protein
MDDVSWVTKACVGVLGGIALSLLKLIDANFYMGASSIVMQAAYFSYAAYMILGGMAAVFLADHDLPPRKIVRSAFVIGLLAPSLLLALASQPIRMTSSGSEGEKLIPKLSFAPVSAAMAQEPAKPASAPVSASHVVTVQEIPASALQPTFSDALKSVLGRDPIPEKYVYVIGSTTDKAKATSAAELVSKALGTQKAKPSVIQVKGQPQFFVTVGGFVDFESAFKIKADSTAAVAKTLGDGQSTSLSSDERSKLAAMFADAPVVKTKALGPSR